jgi:DNA polymerase-3 subunit delta
MTLFFYGPNSYALSRQVRQMVAAYVAKSGSDWGVERIEAAGATQQRLAAALQAAPFLASSRLVIVEGLLSNKSVLEQAAKLMAGVPKSTVVVFVEREPDQRSRAYKALLKADKVVKFELLSAPKLMAWVRAEVERQGGEIEPAAARELVAATGEDQWRLAEEITKLVNYEPKVQVAAVKELVEPSLERSIFDLVEAMSSGNLASALAGYRGLLEQRISEMYMLTMIQWQLRNLLLAKTSPDISPSELAARAGLSPYVAGKVAAAQSKLKEAILEQAFAEAVDCEYDIKTGRVRAEAAVERLVYRVAAVVKAG